MRQIGGAQPLLGAGEALVDDVGRRANDLASFGGAEALHDAQQEASNIGRGQAGKGGLQRLALGNVFFKGQIGGIAIWLAVVASFERFPANEPPSPQERDGSVIGCLEEPAARGFRRVVGGEGRLLAAGGAPGVVKGVLRQIAGLFRVGNQPAEKAEERARCRLTSAVKSSGECGGAGAERSDIHLYQGPRKTPALAVGDSLLVIIKSGGVARSGPRFLERTTGKNRTE